MPKSYLDWSRTTRNNVVPVYGSQRLFRTCGGRSLCGQWLCSMGPPIALSVLGLKADLTIHVGTHFACHLGRLVFPSHRINDQLGSSGKSLEVTDGPSHSTQYPSFASVSGSSSSISSSGSLFPNCSSFTFPLKMSANVCDLIS